MERVAKERERARELATRVTLPVISLRGERECFESGDAGGRMSGENSKEKGAASSGGGRSGEGGRGKGDDDGQRARNGGRSGWW